MLGNAAWGSNAASGFLKPILAQTCLLAWYQLLFLEVCLGILGTLCKGKGVLLARWYGTSAKPESHLTFTLGWYPVRLFELVFGILRGAWGGGEEVPLVPYLCKAQRSRHESVFEKC